MTEAQTPDPPRPRSLPIGLLVIAVVIGFGLGFKLGQESARLEQTQDANTELDGGASSAGQEAESTPGE